MVGVRVKKRIRDRVRVRVKIGVRVNLKKLLLEFIFIEFNNDRGWGGHFHSDQF
jgi:hypothetical protein